MSAVQERVDRLEESIDRFIVSVGIEFNKLYNSQMRTEAELRAFKEEMSAFKQEMSEFKGEMSEFKDEMSDFKDEMSDFKDEMRSYKDEAREEKREMNRKWGEIANKLGTLVEDLVYPSLGRVIKECLGREANRIYLRLKQRLPDGRVREFDAIAVTADLVCLNSTKATLRSADVDHFPEEIAAFREFLPEYRELPLVGILASLTVDDSVLAHAERQGFVVLAVGDELMEVKNRPGFEPKQW
jgi:myosin heavy subunit